MLGAQHSDGLGIAEQLKVGDTEESWQPGADLAVPSWHIWKSLCSARQGPLGVLRKLVSASL